MTKNSTEIIETDTTQPEPVSTPPQPTTIDSSDNSFDDSANNMSTATEVKKENAPKPKSTILSKNQQKVQQLEEKAAKKAQKLEAKTAKKAKKIADKAERKQQKQQERQAQSKKTTNQQSSDLIFRSIIIGLLIVTLLTSCASLAYCIWDFTRGDTPITFNYPDSDGNSASFIEGSIADIATKVTPGVVSIVTEIRGTNFIGMATTSTAAGTGMIVTQDGYVLTNKHVIEGASSVQIVLDDGTTYDDIELVGTDPTNDVAFLKIKNASNLTPVKLGDSKTITAGQPVIAIGNALGQLQNTITYGIISGIGRSITAMSSDYSASESLTDMIQTDAAINSGNSGGPLVNAAGEVIGINTATSSDADGIGFAIPISSIKGMLNSLISTGKLNRAYLGIYYINITPAIAKSYNLPVTAGAYVYSSSQYSAIVKDSPADKAGLKDKDIITKINGFKVSNAGSVSTLLGEYMPGDTVQLTVLRDGKERSINVTLGEYSN